MRRRVRGIGRLHAPRAVTRLGLCVIVWFYYGSLFVGGISLVRLLRGHCLFLFRLLFAKQLFRFASILFQDVLPNGKEGAQEIVCLYLSVRRASAPISPSSRASR
jgi:hypothetical protein